jgi:hypothetical protein
VLSLVVLGWRSVVFTGSSRGGGRRWCSACGAGARLGVRGRFRLAVGSRGFLVRIGPDGDIGTSEGARQSRVLEVDPRSGLLVDQFQRIRLAKSAPVRLQLHVGLARGARPGPVERVLGVGSGPDRGRDICWSGPCRGVRCCPRAGSAHGVTE